MNNLSMFPRLLGDLGGTNARFAVQLTADGDIRYARSMPCQAYAGPAEAVEHYLKSLDLGHPPRTASFGVATPVAGDWVSFTNNPWSFSIAALKERLHLSRLVVVNDFAALAAALPKFSSQDLVQVGSGVEEAHGPKALIGPGTGLGVAGLFYSNGAWLPIPGEGGHVTLAASSAREDAIIERLRLRFGHVSAERALSGPGLRNLYEVVCALECSTAENLDASGILDKALKRDCPFCVEALDLFCAFLGTTASNLALTLGATGGVYVGGGIVPRLGPAFAASKFRERFIDKGRNRSWLEKIPVSVIRAEWPGLVGAASVPH